MFHPRAYENARPDGVAVLEVVDGAEGMSDDGARGEGPAAGIRSAPGVAPYPQPLPRIASPSEAPKRRFVPLKRTVLTGDIAGPLASLTVVHVFGFAPEQSTAVVEALYRFPLPGDAAVTGVRVRFGDVEIEALLQERDAAEAAYEAAKREGQQAALLSRESPDVFTLRVAGIGPGQDVTVETSYVQLARADGPGWTLRVPLTTAPRYVRGDETGARHASGQPLATLRDPGHCFALDVTLHGAAQVTSVTHDLSVSTVEDGRSAHRRVHLRGGEVVPDRDFVLTWRPSQDESRVALQAWLHEDHAYFLALVTPPRVPAPQQGVPRELVILVDHSGSMEGPKWAAADWAVKQLLAELDERDSFALGVFHHTTAWLAERPVPAAMAAVQRAYRFLEQRRDSGGTELGVALEQALSLPRVPGERARHVVVITDAQVTDDGRILRLAEADGRRADRRRISVLCIDAAPNSYLAQELAERGGGVARFLTSAPEEEDISTALDQVLAEWARPVAANLRLEISHPSVDVTGHQVQPARDGAWSAVDLGDLPSGRSRWVVGRLTGALSGAMGVRFRLASGATPGKMAPAGAGASGNPVADAPAAEVSPVMAQLPALRALFGARRVLALEHLIHGGVDEALGRRLAALGYAPDDVAAAAGHAGPRVYAENARRDRERALCRLLAREALAFGLASSETAFVAVRREAGRVVEQTEIVGNALPAGWSDSFVGGGMAQPATFMLASFTPAAAPSPGGAVWRRAMPLRFAETDEAGSLSADLAVFGDASAGALAGAADAAARWPATGRAGGGTPGAVVFSGRPRTVNGEAVLFDSATGQPAALPPDITFSSLSVRLLEGAAPTVHPELRLLVFVEDLATPRAQVRLADVLRQGGTRPLHVSRRQGQILRIVLVDPAGAWAAGAPALEVRLGW